jgi:hypothetical protein
MPLLPINDRSAPSFLSCTTDPVEQAWQATPLIPGRDPALFRLSWDSSRSPIERSLFGAASAGAWSLQAGLAVARPSCRTPRN